MATWTTPIPPNDTVAGDPDHPLLHNELSDNVTEIRTNVDLALPASDPRLTAGAAGTATVRAIGATATTVVAGNDPRLTAGAAGTATVRALGTAAGTAAAGDDTRLVAGAAAVATVRALGITATTAAAGNDARFPTGTAVAQADSVAADIAAMVVDFNALLAKLRTRGVIAP